MIFPETMHIVISMQLEDGAKLWSVSSVAAQRDRTRCVWEFMREDEP